MRTTPAAILASAFTGRARIRAFSCFGTALGVGLAFGPTVAGVLVQGFGWRAVFAGPALACVIVLCLVPMLPESKEPGSREVDWAGTATFTLALLLLIAGFVQGPAWGWSSPAVLVAFAGSVVLLVAFVVVERRQAPPMFDLALLRNGEFIGISLAGAMIVSVPLLLPPVAPLVTKVVPPQGVVVLAVALVGIGSVDPARAGTGAGMFNAVRLALETIAIAVVGAVLATTTGGRLAEPGYTSGLHVALWGMAGLAAVLTVVLARVLPRRRETTARQHPEPSQA